MSKVYDDLGFAVLAPKVVAVDRPPADPAGEELEGWLLDAAGDRCAWVTSGVRCSCEATRAPLRISLGRQLCGDHTLQLQKVAATYGYLDPEGPYRPCFNSLVCQARATHSVRDPNRSNSYLYWCKSCFSVKMLGMPDAR